MASKQEEMLVTELSDLVKKLKPAKSRHLKNDSLRKQDVSSVHSGQAIISHAVKGIDLVFYNFGYHLLNQCTARFPKPENWLAQNDDHAGNVSHEKTKKARRKEAINAVLSASSDDMSKLSYSKGFDLKCIVGQPEDSNSDAQDVMTCLNRYLYSRFNQIFTADAMANDVDVQAFIKSVYTKYLIDPVMNEDFPEWMPPCCDTKNYPSDTQSLLILASAAVLALALLVTFVLSIVAVVSTWGSTSLIAFPLLTLTLIAANTLFSVLVSKVIGKRLVNSNRAKFKLAVHGLKNYFLGSCKEGMEKQCISSALADQFCQHTVVLAKAAISFDLKAKSVGNGCGATDAIASDLGNQVTNHEVGSLVEQVTQDGKQVNGADTHQSAFDNDVLEVIKDPDNNRPCHRHIPTK